MTDLFRLALTYHDQLAAEAESAFLVFLRIGTAVMTLPAFGETSVPARIRLVLAIMLSAAVYPVVQNDVQGFSLESAFAPDIAIGLLLGLLVRLFLLGLMTAGAIIANATSLTQLFPAAAEAQPAMSKLLVMAGLALAFQAGLHLRIVEYLIVSYDLLPAGTWPSDHLIAAWGTAQVGRVFATAFMIAMPFVIASVIYNIALGVMNRAMPQLMVTFIGAPALGLGSLALIVFVAPLSLATWLDDLQRFLGSPTAPVP